MREPTVIRSETAALWHYAAYSVPSALVLAGTMSAVVLLSLPDARSGWWEVVGLGIAVAATMLALRIAMLRAWTCRLHYVLGTQTAELRWGDRLLKRYDDVEQVTWGGRPATARRLVLGRWWSPDLPQLWIDRTGRAPRFFPALLVWDELPALPPPDRAEE